MQTYVYYVFVLYIHILLFCYFLYRYFDGPTKLFSDLYLSKFLNISIKFLKRKFLPY